MLKIETLYKVNGVFFAPNNVMLYNFILISLDIPSIQFNNATQYKVISFNISAYFYLFKNVR